ncbi:MAG: alpha amylase N-terminal ig-like domain-containing protein [Deltaproteobacteria bacterium]|nr:alpha amylase N-terminal ig-like domain-containing protein [Deltaproteobacteria bacterium]
MTLRRFALCVLFGVGLPCLALAAGNDNNVEWYGLAHVHGDTFYYSGDPATPDDTVTIRVRTYKGDVTAVGVIVALEGSTSADFSYVDGAWESNDNTQTYDFWLVTLHGDTHVRRYCPSITDGEDTDYLIEHQTDPFYAVASGPTRPDPSQCWLIPAAYPALDSGVDAAVASDAAQPDSAPLLDAAQPDSAPHPDAAQPDSAPHPDAAQPDSALPTDAARIDSAAADSWRPDAAAADRTAADRAAGPDTAPVPDAGGLDLASGDRQVADTARSDGGSCTPGCQDEQHRLVCNASGQPLVVACTAGTVCRDGVCVEVSEPPVEEPGCGCSAAAGAAPLSLVLAALGLLRRRRVTETAS